MYTLDYYQPVKSDLLLNEHNRNDYSMCEELNPERFKEYILYLYCYDPFKICHCFTDLLEEAWAIVIGDFLAECTHEEFHDAVDYFIENWHGCKTKHK